MKALAGWFDQYRAEGFAIVPDVLNKLQVRELIAVTDSLPNCTGRQRGGVRNLLDAAPEIRRLATSPALLQIAGSVLDKRVFPVRGILFDKTDGANWKVPWHQDLTIEVAEKLETQGFGPWSVKDGVQRVQPPSSILERMISIRIHLDDCPTENGALRVVPGSHNAGRLSENESAEAGLCGPVVVCAVSAGDAMLMSPLIVHASSASERPGHRRVIHLDYADVMLPGGLRWATQTGRGKLNESVSSPQTLFFMALNAAVSRFGICTKLAWPSGRQSFAVMPVLVI